MGDAETIPPPEADWRAVLEWVNATVGRGGEDDLVLALTHLSDRYGVPLEITAGGDGLNRPGKEIGDDGGGDEAQSPTGDRAAEDFADLGLELVHSFGHALPPAGVPLEAAGRAARMAQAMVEAAFERGRAREMDMVLSERLSFDARSRCFYIGQAPRVFARLPERRQRGFLERLLSLVDRLVPRPDWENFVAGANEEDDFFDTAPGAFGAVAIATMCSMIQAYFGAREDPEPAFEAWSVASDDGRLAQAAVRFCLRFLERIFTTALPRAEDAVDGVALGAASEQASALQTMLVEAIVATGARLEFLLSSKADLPIVRALPCSLVIIFCLGIVCVRAHV